MRNLTKILFFSFFVLLLCSGLTAGEEKEIKKTFAKKDSIKLKTAIGDCLLKKSQDDKIHVHVVYNINPEIYEADFSETGTSLRLREEIHGEKKSGTSRWTLAVPDGIKIRFNSGTGYFKVEGLKINIDGNTGTGDVIIKNCEGEVDFNTGTGEIQIEKNKGEFDVNSGTGDIEIKNSSGYFEANSGTGNVEAEDIIFTDDSKFNSGTGDVEIYLAKSSNYDLTISSGTGDAVLNLKGNSPQGYFEFTARADDGRIISPIKFEKEEEYWQGKDKYLRKSFIKGKDTPCFYIRTGTGTARLKLK